MRVLVKFGYVGWRFRGSQTQPHGETVEDALREGLVRLDEDPGTLRLASRTDAGVSARGNALVVETEMDGGELVRGLDAVLDDIYPWGWVDVPEGFDPRDARTRWYRYHLFNRGYDAAAIRQAAGVFEGEHDWSAFAKQDPSRDVDPVRFVESVEVSFQQSFIVVDVQAPAFLWEQVRRMVGALELVGDGELTRDDLAKALDGGELPVVRVADPEGLVLVDIDHGLDVASVREADEAIREDLFARIGRQLTRTQVLKDLTR